MTETAAATRWTHNGDAIEGPGYTLIAASPHYLPEASDYQCADWTASAPLIAAAPTMLTLLQHLRSHFEGDPMQDVIDAAIEEATP